MFAIKGNYFWYFSHGGKRKIPRCKLKICRKKIDVNNNDKVGEKYERVCVKLGKEIRKINQNKRNKWERKYKDEKEIYG